MDTWLNAKSICHWLGKRAQKGHFFDRGLLQLLVKNRLNRNLIFSFFWDKFAIFPTRALQWTGPISLTVTSQLLTLSKYCQMTQHPPPWTSRCETCWNQTMCSFCPHTATWASSSWPSHQLLVGLTAAAFRCCLIKHHCRNNELLGGLAEYADEVLHKNPITDWTQWPD